MRPAVRRLAGLSAAPNWPRPAGRALAVLLHACLLLPFLPFALRRAVPVPVDPPPVEIEMVDQAALRRGAPAPAPAEAPSPPEAPPPPPPAPAPPTPGEGTPPPPAARPGRPAAPAVNLGNAGEDQDPLLVTGDNVVPPRPDAAFHNRPPAYPPEAARRGREGAVLLRAHVGTAGVPERVDVLRSSGDEDMDRAATEAVALWRFRPARNNGVPVPFDYEVNVEFRLGQPGRRR